MALTVGDIMDADPVTAAPDDDVEAVVRLLRTHELPGVPVVNAAGRPVGIVTESDLVLTDGDGDLHLPPGGDRRPPPPAHHGPRGRLRLPRAAAPLRGPPAQGGRAEGQGPHDG